MQLSSKLIKATNAVGLKQIARIETEVKEELLAEGVMSKQGTVPEISLAEKQVQTMLKEAKQVLADAQKEKQSLLEIAQLEIDTMKQVAYDEAYQSGEEAGYNVGYQKGLQKATETVAINNQQELKNIQNLLEQAQEAISQYIKDKRRDFIQMATYMAEKIVHKEIDVSDEGLLSLATPYFYQLDKDEDFVTITIHPSKRPEVEAKLGELEADFANTRFLISVDPKIEEKGLIIESTKSVIDLQIKNQLDRMLKEFDEMERTVDA